LVGAEQLQSAEEVGEQSMVESGPNVCAVPKLAVVLPAAEQEGAERPGPVALALGIASNHEIVGLGSLHLEPLPRALPRLIGTAELLRDDPFQPVLEGGLVGDLADFEEMIQQRD